MPRFVVDLGDVEMSAEAQSALNRDIQKVALGHLAELKMERPIAVKFPHDWVGLIARLDFDRLAAVEKELGAILPSIRAGRSR